MYDWGIVLGLGLSTFYLILLAMLPDVIDLDAVMYPMAQRREGLFTSVMVFLQKLALAIALFSITALLDSITALLEWSGWHSGSDASGLAQPTSALLAIRWIMGPILAATMVVGMLCALFYPLTREQHDHLAGRLAQQPRAHD